MRMNELWKNMDSFININFKENFQVSGNYIVNDTAFRELKTKQTQ